MTDATGPALALPVLLQDRLEEIYLKRFNKSELRRGFRLALRVSDRGSSLFSWNLQAIAESLRVTPRAERTREFKKQA